MDESSFLDEVRRIKEEITASFNYDIEAMCDSLRKEKADNPRVLKSVEEPKRNYQAKAS